ncbi:MAG: hypothetical protein BroJett040_06370 [Oligoflexia bacterium]|nr:MAG: hypothetical protein BroJett040_06370 [Oligoflexia bacterium]
MSYRKKLIEVALPLEAINTESARRKRKAPAGYPTALHKWWAQRPIAAARAVLFAQLIDDPSSNPDLFPTEQAQEKERKRLFHLIEELILWDNTRNEDLLNKIRKEIEMNWKRECERNANHPKAQSLFNPKNPPRFHDPFAGGGSIPVEAQRMGLRSHAGDLNPVAVLINKAMIEIPPRFCNLAPVAANASSQGKLVEKKKWTGAEGIAEDVRRYGEMVRQESAKRLSSLYPKVKITKEMATDRADLKTYIGKELTVVAWIWARTVKSPNPAFSKIDVPLVSTFALSDKAGKEAYIEPVIDKKNYTFEVRRGKSKNKNTKLGTKLARANFTCLLSGAAISGAYIKDEAKAGRLGSRMMTVVLKGDRGRVYISPTKEMEKLAEKLTPEWKPEVPISGSTQYVGVKPYGIEQFSELFSNRQIVMLDTLIQVIHGLHKQIEKDAVKFGMQDDHKQFSEGGNGATAYADAVVVYLTFVFSRVLHYSSNLCSWLLKDAAIRCTFNKQAFQMTWDFAEGNVFGSSSTEWGQCCEVVAKTIETLPAFCEGTAEMADAIDEVPSDSGLIISTDPPYYDNVPYADLSDYFYVWLRRALKPYLPQLFSTIAVPKTKELVAFAYRHEGKDGAEKFFLDGMSKVMHRLSAQAHPSFPVTIYYAFKQSEDDDEGVVSTGWETFLASVISAGFSITGTWPMRTEGDNRTRGVASNALASSIVLVCRPRQESASVTTRRDFISQLKKELPLALIHLRQDGILPVDLAQAAIGPGIGIYSQYKAVLEADDKPMPVRTALALINQILDEILNDTDSDLDSYTKWAISWFEQHQFDEGGFDEANRLAQAKNIGVDALTHAGIVVSKGGKVQLLRRTQLEDDWQPEDKSVSHWIAMQHMIRRLEEYGEGEAGLLLKALGARGELCRDLAYRCFSICERNQWAHEALAYNSLVSSWNEILKQSKNTATQGKFEI